jgi:preprotein translocase subunit SecF
MFSAVVVTNILLQIFARGRLEKIRFILVINMDFLKHSKIYFSIGIILIIASLFSLFYYGLNLGIDFEGGSSLSIEYKNERPDTDKLKKL